MLGCNPCRFLVADYDTDDFPEEFDTAIENFLDSTKAPLKAAEPHIYRYYEDLNALWARGDPEYIEIVEPSLVWDHISISNEAMVSRRAYGDKGVYISLECECSWEPEHGLLIVFKNGNVVTKVGQVDGHLSNADAYADPSLETTIYRSPFN